MHPRLTLLALAFASGVAAPLGAQSADADAAIRTPPTSDSLAAITSRGRRLARYDFAAWHATDAVLALKPGEEEVRGYIARRAGDGWTVSFGRFADDSSAWLVAYDAREVVGTPDSFVVEHHVPARRDTGEVMRRAWALEVARNDFGAPERPYNAAILAASDTSWWVWLLPAQTRQGVFPLGADVRYEVSGDGRRILVKRQLHNAVVEFGAGIAPGQTPQSSFHTAVLDDIPEDTDVLHVLLREPHVAEYVVTNAFVYRIDPSGAIVLLGGREEVLEKK